MELCLDASSITSYEQKEGSFNRAFILTMNDGKRVVARLPTHITGPPRLTTNSEVATIKNCEYSCSIWRERSFQPCKIPVKSEAKIPTKDP